MGLGVFYQQDFLPGRLIFADGAGTGHLARLVNCERRVGSDSVSFRSDCLVQRVFFAGLQAFYHMGFVLLAHPLVYYVAFLVKNLDRRAFQFFAVSHIHLCDPDGCQFVLDQDNVVAVLILADGSAAFRDDVAFCVIGRNHTMFIDAELGVSCDLVPIRSRLFMQDVDLVNLQILDIGRSRAGSKVSDFNRLAFIIHFLRREDLNQCAFQFYIAGDVCLGSLHNDVGEVIRGRISRDPVNIDSTGTVIFKFYCNVVRGSVIDNSLIPFSLVELFDNGVVLRSLDESVFIFIQIFSSILDGFETVFAFRIISCGFNQLFSRINNRECFVSLVQFEGEFSAIRLEVAVD